MPALKMAGYKLGTTALGGAIGYGLGGADGMLAGMGYGRMAGNAALMAVPSLRNWLLKACFTGDVLARARGSWGEGWRRFDLLDVGDEVLSRDEYNANGPLEWKSVEEKFVRTGRIWHLHFDGGKLLRTTGEHPFFAFGKGWVAASELVVGDLINRDDGQWIAVEDIYDTGDYETVYNVRVADFHTYFVAAAASWGFGVWAHNSYSPNAAEKANPHLAGKTPEAGTRGTGVKRAARLEVELVQKTRAGTVDWNASEIAFIQQNGRLPRNTVVGHHINNVDVHPNWAGDPRNINFVRGQTANLTEHGGNFQNPTTGPLIDRAAMIAAIGG